MSSQDLLKNLSPKNQNQIQKIGFFIFISAAILLVVLHFPFNGYTIYHSAFNGTDTSGCPAGYINFNCMTTLERDEILPVLLWSSTSPIIPWLGNILNFLVAISATLALGLLWIFIFKTSPNDPHLKNNDHSHG